MTQNLNLSINSEEVLEALSHLSREDYLEILQDIDPVAWCELNRVLKGKPFSFEGRNYLLQPYRDEHPHLIFYKGRQVEMSEFSMNWLFRKLWQHPYTAGLHTFPRDRQCLRFSKQRLETAIHDSPRLSNWKNDRESDKRMIKLEKPTNKQGLKPYNFYVLGGTWESRKDSAGDAARGLTIDFIVYDERQDHPSDVEAVVGEAMSHSEFKQSLTLGTPKLPGSQFDQQWEASDKHLWHVHCECGRCEPITLDDILQVEEHPESGIDPDEHYYYYGCRFCGKPLNRQNGEWIATNPQRKPLYRGYHINQLMVPWITADEIMRKKNSPNYTTRKFHNEVLGLAYGGDDVPITIQMIYACAENEYKIGESLGDIYVGIDWGHTSYMVLENKTKEGHKMVDIFICNHKDPRKHPYEFVQILKKYKGQVRRVVCDAGPDITYFYNLRDELKKEKITSDVWSCYYATPPAKTTTKWNEKEECVTVGRSEYIEIIADEIKDERYIIPGAHKSLEKIETFMDHCTNIAAERAETASGVEFIIYKNTGPDHFLHAKLYATVASSEASGISIGSTALPVQPTRQTSLNKKTLSDSDPYGRLDNKNHRGSTKAKVFPTFNMKRRRRNY